MLNTIRNYSIQSRGIYYDVSLDDIVTKEQKGASTIYFPSKGEFDCFMLLRQLFHPPSFILKPHSRERLASLSWVIDFKVEASNNQGKKQLAKIVNVLNGAEFNNLNYLLIEYKGFADENFRYKLRQLHRQTPIRFKQLVVLSSKDDVYSFDGVTKKIYGVEVLHKIKLVLS